MKRILLILLLSLGLYPVLDHGKLDIAVTRTMADSWGDEDGDYAYDPHEDEYDYQRDDFDGSEIGAFEGALGDAGYNTAPEFAPGDMYYNDTMSHMSIPYGSDTFIEYQYNYATDNWDFTGVRGENPFGDSEPPGGSDPSGMANWWLEQLDNEPDPSGHENDPYYYFDPFQDMGMPGITPQTKQDLEAVDDQRVKDEINSEDAADNAAPTDCYGTGRSGSIRWQGNLEHWLIQHNYLTLNPGAMKEYSIPGAGPSGGRGFADLANPATGEMFEIKPTTPAAVTAGSIELANYITKANFSCPPAGGVGSWVQGGLYSPRLLIVPGNTQLLLAEVIPTFPGIIQYSYISPSSLPQGVPVPVPVVLPPNLATKLNTLIAQVATVYQAAGDINQVILDYLRANPDLRAYIKAAAVGIIIATIVEDVLTGGVGIADDWASFVIARSIWRVADKMVLIF